LVPPDVVAEVGFSAWISPYAALSGLASQADAALLVSAYYVPYTATRAGGYLIDRVFKSVQLFRISFVGSLVSLAVVGLAGATRSTTLLWLGTGAFGKIVAIPLRCMRVFC